METKNFNEMEASEIAKAIVSKFSEMNGSNFIGVRGYENDYKELANYILIADFKWVKAVEKSVAILNSLTESDFNTMAEKSGCCNVSGIRYSNLAEGKLYLESGKLPKEGTKARDKVLESIKVTKTLAEYRDAMVQQLLNNLDPEKRSAQSEAQIEAYLRIEKDGKIIPSIKVHKLNKTIHIWAMAHSKDIIVNGVYPESEKRLEAKQKDAIEKYCKYTFKDAEGKCAELPVTKYRNLVVNYNQMAEVVAKGDTITLAE
jgi:hypothetical protein